MVGGASFIIFFGFEVVWGFRGFEETGHLRVG